MKSDPRDAGQTMQRVKVGMTGLAFVLLLIGLASVIFSSASRERPIAVAGAAKPDPMTNAMLANEAAASEPLAEIGVAPSTQDDTANQAAVPAR